MFLPEHIVPPQAGRVPGFFSEKEPLQGIYEPTIDVEKRNKLKTMEVPK
jgi:hypothetical protein